MDTPTSNPFSRWLWERLEESEKSQVELARGLGVSQSTLSDWLNGKSLPSRRSMRRLAAYFDVDPALIQNLVAQSEVRELRREAEPPMPGLLVLGRPSYIRQQTLRRIERMIEEDYRLWIGETRGREGEMQ
jgi:transcriptional regulator with XRE-family HTH domain